MATQIQLRRGTAAAWTSANPTLAIGEMGVETDTNKFKIGDGATAWTSLAYATIDPASHALGGSAHSSDTLANLNSKISDATLIDTGDSRLSDSRTCNNSFDDASTARTNLGVYSTSEVDAKVVGLYDHKGAYDADTNSPDLDSSPTGIKKGDAYTVSVAGNFFTEAVEVGDVLIADQDDPTALAHWTRVNKNISFGSSAGTACEGNDSRLSDARTPTSHASSHNAGGGDALAIDAAAGTGSLRTLGTSGTAACAGNDSRLSDARAPTSHASSHQSGGGDAIKLDDLSAPDDNTDLDASVSKHGLLPKLGGGTTNFLRADGSWAAPPGGSGVIPVMFSYGSTAGPYQELAAPTDTYMLIDDFIYAGTSILGSATVSKLMVSASSSSPLQWRIWDRTNSLQICEGTAGNHQSVQTINLGTVSNLPSGFAEFEIQVREVPSSSTKARIHASYLG